MPGRTAQKIKELADELKFKLGLTKEERLLAGSGQRILVYHGIDQKGEKGLNSRFISASRFETQIRFLKDHCNLVSLDDYFNHSSRDNSFTISITFDDGYQNNLRYALPILEKYGVPATFFLTSACGREASWLWMDFLDIATRHGPSKIIIVDRIYYKKKWRHSQYYADQHGQSLVEMLKQSAWSTVLEMERAFKDAGAWPVTKSYDEYWQLLTPDDITKLVSSPLVTIGAHGHTHRDLARLNHYEACHEIAECKKVLEKICRQSIHTLAYPFGSYTRELLDHADSLGFTRQLAVRYLHGEDFTDMRIRDRMVINPYGSDRSQWLAVRDGKY